MAAFVDFSLIMLLLILYERYEIPPVEDEKDAIRVKQKALVLKKK